MLPSIKAKPNGLHRKYLIEKVVGYKYSHDDFFGDPVYVEVTKPISDKFEAFVLRLDDFGDDKVHIDACRKAVLHYAELIKCHLPELSKDLIERYSKTQTNG